MANVPTSQQRPVLERLSTIEKGQQDLYQTLDAIFSQTRNNTTLVMQTLEGIMGVLKQNDAAFDTKVDDFMKVKRQERVQAKADREKQEIEMLVKNNELKPVDVVGQDSVVVGRMFEPTGEVVGAGRDQAPFGGFAPDAQKAMLGQGVGFMYEAPNKSKFEVLEIYDSVPKAEVPVATPPQVVAPVVTPAPVPEVVSAPNTTPTA
jgi:hypothetical protein